jgi:hypothetical protein
MKKPLTDFIRDHAKESKPFVILFQDTEAARTALDTFLNARLDINRIRAAQDFVSSSIFELIDWKEIAVLRDAVTQRELRRNMRYPKYRDHTAHTVWGFLLGCTWYERCEPLRKAIETAGILDAPDPDKPVDEDRLQAFAGFWTLAFLCHDIGYLFEADIPGGPTPDPLLDLQAAAATLNDYYQSTYPYIMTGSRSTEVLDALNNPAIHYPAFTNQSLGFAARQLRSVPLRAVRIHDQNNVVHELPADVFELFRDVGCVDVEAVEEAFVYLYMKGQNGQRFLDHGVCSGLMLAQVVVLSYGLYMVTHYPVHSPVGAAKFALQAHVVKSLQDHWASDHYAMNLTWDMLRRRIRWVFAAARHNLDPKWWDSAEFNGKETSFTKISPKTDLASFLVTLVDTIQDWDRPLMNTHSSSAYIMDSQHLEIEINDKLHLYARKIPGLQKRLESLQKELDERLDGWKDFVTIHL